MKFIKESLPVFCIENKDVIMIKDPFVLGIYAFLQMLYQKGDTKRNLNDVLKIQFPNEEAYKISYSLKVIKELGLIMFQS